MWDGTINNTIADSEGMKVILDVTINDKQFHLTNIYSPTKDTWKEQIGFVLIQCKHLGHYYLW